MILDSEITEVGFATQFSFDGDSLKIDISSHDEPPPMGFVVTLLACLINFSDAHEIDLKEAMAMAIQAAKAMMSNPSELHN